ncbi:unnamed protein product [Adineta steineri]|uniref:TRPM SLOG domain-containing protein n=2 Tax=Adineta steineri TaxID=433720 RepID=A0A815MX06_9BILA|nr:unnamed protein product [Adineta steineri]CAF1624103.1 unnamed protein product [Adineta steineri]
MFLIPSTANIPENPTKKGCDLRLYVHIYIYVWVLTNGIYSSITKLLGEINRTNPDPSQSIHFIGIASWGCVSSVEQLDVYGTNVIYNKPKTDERSFASNHVLLIFIDNDTKHEYGIHENVLKNKVSVLLLQGAGGCCDLFASEDPLTMKENEQIKTKLREQLKIIDNKLNPESTMNSSIEHDEIVYFELNYNLIQDFNNPLRAKYI